MQWKLNWYGDLFTNGENLHGKNPMGDFNVTTPENSLLSQQTVTSKGIPIPYTNLQLNPYPNTELHLFCSDNLSFSMYDSQYVTNQFDARILIRDLLTNLRKITKLFGYKTLWCINTAASSRERWTRPNSVSGHNLHEQNFASHLYNCA